MSTNAPSNAMSLPSRLNAGRPFHERFKDGAKNFAQSAVILAATALAVFGILSITHGGGGVADAATATP